MYMLLVVRDTDASRSGAFQGFVDTREVRAGWRPSETVVPGVCDRCALSGGARRVSRPVRAGVEHAAPRVGARCASTECQLANN